MYVIGGIVLVVAPFIYLAIKRSKSSIVVEKSPTIEGDINHQKRQRAINNDIINQLDNLERLKNDGMYTQEEYEYQKQNILREND